MNSTEQYVVFAGFSCIAAGDLRAVVSAAWESRREGNETALLFFDTTSGRQIDFNLEGTLEEVLARVLPPEPKKGPGRPRLGVVCGEVSLLPRHWSWLERQPKSASGTIRRLIEAARREVSVEDFSRERIEAADRFMWAMAGNLAGCEEASRALYAKRWSVFDRLVDHWPADVAGHLKKMLRPLRNPFTGGTGRRIEILEPLKQRYESPAADGEPWRLGAAAVRVALAEGRFSAVQVAEACLNRISRINPALNAVTSVFEEEALSAAREIDRKLAAGEEAGILAGVPFTVKGNLDVAGHPATHGSVAMQDVVATADAPIVRRLKTAGAIPLGQTNLPDLALRFHTSSRLYGATRNPWGRDLSPGGSSGGEGAAVAAGLSSLGLGNDAGGSLRIPALFCGVAALKPSFGRIPSDRSVGPRNLPLASQIIPVDGLLARSVADLHLAYQVVAGPDPADPRVAPVPIFPEKADTKLRVALVKDPGGLGVAPAVQRELERAGEILAAHGYEIEEVDLPGIQEVTEAYEGMIMTEFGQQRTLLERLLGPDGLRYIDFALAEGRPADLKGYLDLTASRQGLQRAWAGFFVDYPLVLGPVFTGELVPPDYDIRGIDEFREVARGMRLCKASSFLGIPAVAVPTGIRTMRPCGVQLLAGWYREDLCLEAAARIEEACGTITPLDPV